MKRNYKDIETILILTGVYDWDDNGKILIIKKDNGFEVNGFEFASLKAAYDFIESYPKNGILSKGTKVAAGFAKASARGSAKLVGTGLRWTGKKLDTLGIAIKNSLNK